MGLLVGVDIGGTFTDLCAYDPGAGRLIDAKSLTVPEEFARGVWDCLEKAGIDVADVDSLVHGSTVAINIVIERTGARGVLVTTRGARDVYAIGRQNRPEAYNLDFERPEPLIPRSRTLEVDERIDGTGRIVEELADEHVEQIADAVAAFEPESVAICLLHAYRVPAHEVALGRAIRERLPDAHVSLSHEISGEYREYERTSTTVVNAYVGPRSAAYLEGIEQRLAAGGFDGRLTIMQSNGGLVAAATAKRLPVGMMESGPVSGVIASAHLGKRLGFPDLIAFDMGGTTAKTALILDGVAPIASGYFVDGYASGHPVMLPVVDIVEVGTGGGSIAWLDEAGNPKVGPRSASASPGPISYGRGGVAPTVTDANVVLGRISPTSFLGGELQLDEPAARAGIERDIAGPLGLSVDAAALGILRIAVAKMSLAVRQVSIERGHDTRDLAMTALGGAGPLHALAIARELHIPTVIVPRFPAHFSALGMLIGDYQHDYVRTSPASLADADLEALDALYAELIEDARATLIDEGVAPDACRFERSADLRYEGQEFTLNVAVTEDALASAGVDALRDRFHAIYEQRFGLGGVDEPVELVNVRLRALGDRPKPDFAAAPQAQASADGAAPTRPIVLDDPERPQQCAVHRREQLAPGSEVHGPCVIEEYASTTVMFEGDVARISDSGEIVIAVRG